MDGFVYDVMRLERARLEKALTREELGRSASVSPWTVGQILSGKSCRPGTIKKIADALGVPMNELVVARPASA